MKINTDVAFEALGNSARLTRFAFFLSTMRGFSSLAKIYCIFYLGVIRPTGTGIAAAVVVVVGGHCSPGGHHWPQIHFQFDSQRKRLVALVE